MTDERRLEETIRRVFDEVWQEQQGTAPPQLVDNTILLDTGLESLGFAVIITRLEEELSYDPFSLSDDAYYPQTYGEFVGFYETHWPSG